VWQFLLARAALGAWPRTQGSWSITTGFAEIPQHPPVRLAFEDVVVQVRGLHTLLSGEYRIPVTLVGARGSNADLTVEMRFHQNATPGAAGDIVKSWDVTLPAGQRQQID